MKINQIELYYVKAPLEDKKPGFFKQPAYFNPSWIPGFRQSEMRFYMLKLTTNHGHEGYAAIPAMGTERQGLGQMLGNYLLGINPVDIGLVNQRIQEFSYIGMRNSWVEAAFWDIIGKIKGEPLWKMLGGSGGFIYPYLSSGSTHGHDPAKSREIVRKAMDQGFRGVKLRVKSDRIDPMEKYVGAARDEVGDEINIMVDANQGWPVDLFDETPKWSVEFALEFAQALERYDVKWLEEPLNRGNFEGLAELRANTSTPIAGGELNSTWRDFKAMLDIGSLDIYQPDAVMAGGTYAGGISVSYWLIREIQKRNRENKDVGKIKYCPHTWTTGLGFAVALQMIGVLPPEERSLIEYPFEGDWNPKYWSCFLKNDFSLDREGRIEIPDGPGLGVEIDMNVIKRFGKRIYLGTAVTVARHTLLDRGLKQTMYLKGKKEEQLARSAKAEFAIPQAPF